MIAKHPLFYLDDLNELKLDKGYWYIATPYSKYKDGLEAAWNAALFADIQLQNLGIRTFGPIRISHPIAMMTGLDPYDYDIWVPMNKPFIDKAHGMVIVTFPGWEDSTGIAEEIKIVASQSKPIFLLDPKTLGWGGDALPAADEDHVTIPGYKEEIDFEGWPDHLPLETFKRQFGEPVDNPKQACGAKKVPHSAVPQTVMAEVAVAMHEGALKYGRHNYRAAGEILASTYYDATRRHLDDWWEGKDFDSHAGVRLHEITKAIASLTVLRDSMIQGRFRDDRPPKAPSHWLDQLNAMVVELNGKSPAPVAPFVEKAA